MYNNEDQTNSNYCDTLSTVHPYDASALSCNSLYDVSDVWYCLSCSLDLTWFIYFRWIDRYARESKVVGDLLLCMWAKTDKTSPSMVRCRCWVMCLCVYLKNHWSGNRVKTTRRKKYTCTNVVAKGSWYKKRSNTYSPWRQVTSRVTLRLLFHVFHYTFECTQVTIYHQTYLYKPHT